MKFREFVEQSCWRVGTLAVVLAACSARAATAQGVVPGSGTRITDAGDNFEDAKWSSVPQLPKAATISIFKTAYPAGQSTNGLWLERRSAVIPTS